jgi:hypothetical protein
LISVSAIGQDPALVLPISEPHKLCPWDPSYFCPPFPLPVFQVFLNQIYVCISCLPIRATFPSHRNIFCFKGLCPYKATLPGSFEYGIIVNFQTVEYMKYLSDIIQCPTRWQCNEYHHKKFRKSLS